MLKYLNMSQLWDIANEKGAGCFSHVEWKIADQVTFFRYQCVSGWWYHLYVTYE